MAGPNPSHHGYQKSLCHILLAPVGIGTAINALAVLAGGSIGTLAGARLPEGMRSTAMQAIGIVTLLVGVSHFLKVENVLVPLVSVILGLVVGELWIWTGGYSGWEIIWRRGSRRVRVRSAGLS